jgi:hypothetical protein
VVRIESVISDRGGSLPACDMCKEGMQAFADRFGVQVVYTRTGARGMPLDEEYVANPQNRGARRGCK